LDTWQVVQNIFQRTGSVSPSRRERMKSRIRITNLETCAAVTENLTEAFA
jgi:hypothetical protein